MSHLENDKFAEIVLSLGFCSRDQIRRCLKIQGDTKENLSLGQSLLREGFISGEQHSQVLKKFRESAKRATPGADRPQAEAPTLDARSDDLLGKLAVREGWLTPADLKACLQAEEVGALRRPLGEILIARGHLTPARAQELLARVSRRPMCCRSCEKQFTVFSIAHSRKVACPACKGPLEEERLVDRRPAKDPLATQTFKAITQSLPPSRRPRFR